ncbi:HAMP domain-containing protein [Aquabacterium lacunae]|uniref:HAMP domain-containing protein n=1 Tax=Aquabacterium lacunae TaxID=2528630 RepID=A0A4V6MTQ8_9BURK|nr:methyl-accepting chemotaxis protein [Aquabacterium lacunae]TBO30060.1 HAMP domain-containing protein [Aquabacterium lacunae]
MTLNHWRIGTRIRALAVLLLLALSLIGAVACYHVRQATVHLSVLAHQAGTAQESIDLARGAQVAFKTQVQEWKNILLRGGKPEAFEKHLKGFRKEGALTQERLGQLAPRYQALGLDPAQVAQLQTTHQTLVREYEEALTLYDASQPEASAQVVDKAVKGKDRPPTEQMDRLVERVLTHARELNARATTEATARETSTLWGLASLWLCTLAMGITAAVLIQRSITTPLQHAVQTVTDVANGQLGRRTEVTGRDEVAQLLQAMNQMSGSLEGVVSQVRASATLVAQASAEIETGNLDLSTRTEQQAANLQASAQTIDQLSEGVGHNSEAASQARDLAHQASEIAEQGGHVVSQVVQTMANIHDSSTRIHDIVGVIDSIAFQTNILALNAAVEAARAGEQGRGFAVVASEVRALAQRSATAAQEIKSLIQTSVDRVQQGTELVEDAGTTIERTVRSVQQVRQVIADIADGARLQADGIAQVNRAVVDLDQTMQQNAALVEQAAAAASSLREQAQSLNRAVAFFHD